MVSVSGILCKNLQGISCYSLGVPQLDFQKYFTELSEHLFEVWIKYRFPLLEQQKVRPLSYLDLLQLTYPP